MQSDDEEDDDDEAERREIEMERQYRQMRASSIYSVGAKFKLLLQNPRPVLRTLTMVELVRLKF